MASRSATAGGSSTPPSTSIAFALSDCGVPRGSAHLANRMAQAVSVALVPNIHRHDRLSTRTPPSRAPTPPTTGAAVATTPMPNGTRSRGMSSRTRPNDRGMAAADNPCRPRPMMMPSSDSEDRLSSEPNSAMPSTASSMRLRPNRSPRRPASATEDAAAR
jgi:hypothetical protein